MIKETNSDRAEAPRNGKVLGVLNTALTISPIRDANDKIVGASKIAHDITGRKHASELSKAEESERQRRASGLHDNLGQMLTVCKLRLDSLDKNYLSAKIMAEIEDVTRPTGDALKYTRELMLELKPSLVFDNEDLEEILAWAAQSVEKHGLSITIENDGKPKPLTNQVQIALRKAVRELLFNVVKHAGVDESHIDLARENQRIHVRIKDEEEGFEMKQNDPPPTREDGIGLFNIRERIDLPGGSVSIKTEPGNDTKTILSVPVNIENKKSRKPAAGSSSETAKTEASLKADHQNKLIKILLVDDHEMVRKGLRKMIEEENDMTILAEAADGKEAIQLASEKNPDVIVMDVNMPHMDGIEATKNILAKHPHIQVIGLSLYDNKEVAETMRRAGASAYLSKTEAFESLCSTIRKTAG